MNEKTYILELIKDALAHTKRKVFEKRLSVSQDLPEEAASVINDRQQKELLFEAAEALCDGEIHSVRYETCARHRDNYEEIFGDEIRARLYVDELTPRIEEIEPEKLMSRELLAAMRNAKFDAIDVAEIAHVHARLKAVEAELATVKAERAAAIRDLAVAMPYVFCKNKSKENCAVSEYNGVRDCDYCEKWEWRGVQDKEKDDERTT